MDRHCAAATLMDGDCRAAELAANVVPCAASRLSVRGACRGSFVSGYTEREVFELLGIRATAKAKAAAAKPKAAPKPKAKAKAKAKAGVSLWVTTDTMQHLRVGRFLQHLAVGSHSLDSATAQGSTKSSHLRSRRTFAPI